MSDLLPLFDKKKSPHTSPTRASKGVGKKAQPGSGESEDDPSLVLKPLLADLKDITLRQRVLPRYLYDQLITEPVLDPQTAEPRGPVLGQVTGHNLHCQRIKAEHLHLIWIHDGQLRYGLVWRDRPIERYAEIDETMQRTTAGLAILRSLKGWVPPELPDPNSLEPPLCQLVVGQELFPYRPHDTLVEWWAHSLQRPLPAFVMQHRRPLDSLGANDTPPLIAPRAPEVVKGELAGMLVELVGDRVTEGSVEQVLLELCAEHRRLRERWQQAYDDWQSLPQIFIGR